jgi:imidazolonepropionase-like amidohydrolase
LRYLLKNGRFLDPNQPDLIDGIELLTDGARVAEVSDKPINAPGATVIDLGGRTLMPGLIDCHIHVYLSHIDFGKLASWPRTRMAIEAQHLMRAMLDRGFTTVRDMGGADFGIRDAVEEGRAVGPRLFIAGMALSPTGGHGDWRRRTDHGSFCFCNTGLALVGRLADGVPAVLEAARDELRKGADHIKIMASGGVASPYDPLLGLQYTKDEVKVVVEEATNWGKYVGAHAYSAPAIARVVELGVRTIEHGNLIDAATARLMAEKDAFLVPTLATYDAMKHKGASLGMPKDMLAKNDEVYFAGIQALEHARAAGVNVAFGSDLLGELQTHQTNEFRIRSEVFTMQQIIQSATTMAAKLLRKEGELGVLAPGAFADLLVVNGNPLKDPDIFQDGGPNLAAIMKAGEFHRNSL